MDRSWNRIIYFETLDDWIRQYGSFGQTNCQVRWPRSIDALVPNNETGFNYYYWIYLADTHNNRIVRIQYDWRMANQFIICQTPITGQGLNRPTDIDLNDGGTFWSSGEGSTYQDNYLWVVNSPNGSPYEIKCITVGGTPITTYTNYGCDGVLGHLCNVVDIVSGRDPFPPAPHSNNEQFYVADVGNNSIFWMTKYPWFNDRDTIGWLGRTPCSNGIADMEVDYWGHLWVADSITGILTKYTSDLFPLCSFGGTGTGVNQFIKPLSIGSHVGYLGNSNMFVIEDWTDTSGGQYFAIGTDVVDFSVTSSFDKYFHYVNFVLISPSKVRIDVLNSQGALVKNILDGTFLSGEGTYAWDGKSMTGVEQPTGEYQVLIVDTSSTGSISTGLPTNVVTKQAWFHHEFHCCNADGVRGDVDNYCSASCITVLDVNYLVNYIFRAGPAPVCPAEGNVDGVGNIGVLDLNYLVNKVFRAGPLPPPCP